MNKECGYGGTGRRARLRIWWGTPCRFDSCYPHYRKLLEFYIPGAFFYISGVIFTFHRGKTYVTISVTDSCLTITDGHFCITQKEGDSLMGITCGNRYGVFPLWKRLIACVMIVLALSVFEGDGAYQEHLKIPVGYCSAGGRQLVNERLDEECFEKNGFLPVIYMYDSTPEMMDALAEDEISVALVDEAELTFDNKMTDNRIILWLKIDNKYNTLVCVRKHFLEEHLGTAARFTKACSKESPGNIEVIPFKEWVAALTKDGYNAEALMPYMAPDFADEMGEERRFEVSEF